MSEIAGPDQSQTATGDRQSRTTWLRAQLDDDERVARAAERYWHGVRVESATSAEEDHARRHDPARVLAEVDAKRQRLALIETLLENPPTADDGPWAAEAYKGDALVAYGLLRIEALPYADRPGYRDEWRPQ